MKGIVSGGGTTGRITERVEAAQREVSTRKTSPASKIESRIKSTDRVVKQSLIDKVETPSVRSITEAIEKSSD